MPKLIDFVAGGAIFLTVAMFNKPKYVSITDTLPHAVMWDKGNPRIYQKAADVDVDISWNGKNWHHLIGESCRKGDGYNPFNHCKPPFGKGNFCD